MTVTATPRTLLLTAAALAASVTLLALAALAAAPAPADAASRATAAGSCRGANAIPTARTLNRARRAMRCLINRERRRRDLVRLSHRRTLRVAANRHSRDMIRRNYFSHESPGGGTLLDRVRRARYLRGVRGYSIGENIAWGTGRLATPARIHESLMDSPGHRGNILRRRFRNVGVGITLGVPERVRGRGATWTIDFGQRSR